MKKAEVIKLGDKDLQLRYFLGGLEFIIDGEDQMCDYWGCRINCTCCIAPEDSRLEEVKKFIEKHNFTNEQFLRMSYCYLQGYIFKYKGKQTPLFLELENVLSPYNFTHTQFGQKENDFREKELESIINESIVKEFCEKYSIDITDFIALAKTSLNYNFKVVHVNPNPNNTFHHELKEIISSHGFYVSREQIEEYHNEYKKSPESTQLVLDTKHAQKRYLELMKELLKANPEIATEMISAELQELGLNSRIDKKPKVRKLTRKPDNNKQDN